MIQGNRIVLREKKLSDARNDYAWETDHELAYLDAAPIIVSTFSQYQENYAEELRYVMPNSQRYAVDTVKGKHIGNCSYYNIDKRKGEAELGIMVGNRRYWNRGYGTDIVKTMVRHIFSEIGLKRIYLKTLESNIRAQQCFQKCGFTRYGHREKDGFSFMLMEMHRSQWLETSDNGLNPDMPMD